MSTTTRDLLATAPLDIARLEAHLNGLDQAAKVSFARDLKKADMVRLWAAAKGRAATAEDFVPSGVAEGVEVIHEGKNSLPMFTTFQKRFTTARDGSGHLWGYNHGARWLNWVTAGPGYFVAFHDAAHGEYGINYYDVPPKDAQLPGGWPGVRRNEFGIQRFIYGKMIDYMRKISDGVTIGQAWKKGQETQNYFVLVRTRS